MPELHPKFLFDDKHRPVLVQLTFEEFEQIQEYLADAEMGRMIQEAASEHPVSGSEGWALYDSLPKNPQ